MSKESEWQVAYYQRRMQEDPAAWRAYKNAIAHAWRRRNPEKNAAHCKVYRAIRRGDLVRPEQCSSCGKTCKPEAAHTDYSKPLEVLWMCPACHGEFDAVNH